MLTGTALAHRYRLEAELGQGGMGTVYRAHDTLLDRPVAVKVLNTSALGGQAGARLLEEARATARLNHPNIVSLYDAGQAEGQPFIVMELVEGTTLFGHAPADLPAIIAIARQVCAALDHAHRQGILHRDLKPENVMLTRAGGVKLTDFGLARSLASRLTSEGTIVGTVFYLAPEIMLGQAIDARTDLYALGVMLYELTTGKLPFDGHDPVSVISQHLYTAPMPPCAHNPAIPAALNSLILQLLEKQPAARPSSAAAVLAALEGWQADGPSDQVISLSVLDRIVRGRMIGRERELAEASAIWRRALAGQGHVLAVSGEPGIGKSRLVRELTALAEVTGAVILRGECYAEGSAPYAPLGQMWRSLTDPGASTGIDPVIALPAALRDDLLSMIPGHPYGPARPLLDAQAEQQRQFDAAVSVLHLLSAERPVLVVLEDAHWGDSGTLFALRHVVRRSAQRRILIVITYREVELDRSNSLPDVIHDLNRERLLTRLKLTRLNRAQVRMLLAVMFGQAESDISEALLDDLYRETEGNPFFLEEVCKALIEDGQLRFEDGRWQRATHDELHIPQSVRVTIGTRLSKLPEPAQQALHMAAILGREFDFDTLQTASEVSEPVLIEALESAVRAQLVSETTNGSGLTFTFAHALIPSALRESMSGPRLRLLHRRAAAAVERLRPNDHEALAYHASRAGDDQRARAAFGRAADRALTVFANHEAEGHYRAALDLCPLDAIPAADQGPWLAGLGEALFRQGRFREARETWERAADACLAAGNHDRAAYVIGRQARAAWYEAEPALGLQVALAGLARIPREPATPGLAALLHETGRAYLFNAPGLKQASPEGRAYCEQALQLAEHFGLIEIQAESLTTLALAIGQSTDEGIALLRRAIALTEPAGLYASASRAYFNLSGALSEHDGRIDAGIAAMRRASELAHRTGQTVMALDILLNAVDQAVTSGDFEAAARDLQTIEQDLQSVPNATSVALNARAITAELLIYRGEWDEAEHLLAGLAEVSAQPHDKATTLVLQRTRFVRALLMTERGDYTAAASTLRALLDDQPYRVDHDEVGPLCLLAIALARLGGGDGAQQAVAEAKRIAGNPPKFVAPLQLGWAEAEGCLLAGDLAQALTHLEAATRTAAALKLRWFEARLHERCAEVVALVSPPDPTRVLAQLRQAQGLYQAVHAARYAERVSKKLDEFATQTPT